MTTLPSFKYFGFHFNQPLYSSLDNLKCLKKLTFGYVFNQLLYSSLDKLIGLKQLTFGVKFNQPLYSSLDKLIKLEKLTFNYYFNKPLCSSLDNLPNEVEELVLGYYVNLELNNLPTSIKKISIRNELYDHELNNLPNSLELLELPPTYNKIIKNKPPLLSVIKSNKNLK